MNKTSMLNLFKLIRILILLALFFLYWRSKNIVYFYFAIPFILGIMISFSLKQKRKNP